MGLFKNFFGLFRKKKVVHVELDPQSVKEHNIIKALANENAALKGEKAKLISQIGEFREQEEDKKEDEEVRLELNEQKKELQKKVYPKYFSLKNFFSKFIHSKKFRDKLGVCSFDRAKKLAKFGDIGFSSDGDFVILDNQNKVIIKMRNLNDIFQSVGGLGNDVETYKIPINLDKEMGYVENIMVWEPSELIKRRDGKFEYTKAKKAPLYHYLSKLRGDISDLNAELEEKERTIGEIQIERDKSEMDYLTSQKELETLRRDISRVELRTIAREQIFRNMEKELAQMRGIYAVSGDYIDQLEGELEKMREIAEGEATKESLNKALKLLLMVKERLIGEQQLPQISVNLPKTEKEPPKQVIS